ncbi:MAG: DUF72 domain-containing protein [Pyrinomonadaceae bacterium]|nr:DUF72 domain-containing protein [Pyrinomonadaceae bacterium]
MENQKPKIYIGTQGWNYPDWINKIGVENIFYPRGTKTNEMLEIYSKAFETVEVDSTFYAIPPISTFENWYKKTSKDFIFSLKLPQEITHVHALREDSFPILEIFCESAKNLKEKLGIILIQMPPNFDGNKENAKNLRTFLAKLPKDIRFSIEFRNRYWLIDWTFQELSQHNVSLCLTEGNWIPRQMFFDAPETSDFAYIRFMGERDLESFDKVVRPQTVNMQMWKEKIETLTAKQIFVTYSNFYEGFAIASCNSFKQICGQQIIDSREFETQTSLF